MLEGLTREMKLRSLHNTHFMNTWYGHGTHTTLQTLYNNFKPLYKALYIPQRDLLSYLPKINYSKFNINPINNYIKAFKKKNEKYILVCNNDCNSNQSTNFDMNPLIKEIAEKFKNDTIIVTNDQQNRINMNNVVYFKDILDIEIDLNEISYLSTKCDVIIGKNSGPHTFCYVEENINRNSCFISIVNQRWPYYDFGLKQLNTRSTFINIDVNKINEIVNHIKGFCDASNK